MNQNFSFPKEARLRNARDFRLVHKLGEEHVGRLMHVQIRRVKHPGRKLGLTVSRRFGKATQRNRFKRLVREAFRLSQHELPDQIHLNIRPRAHAEKATFHMLRDELLSLLSPTQAQT